MSVRVETIGNATLYLGDARAIMPTIGRVDAVVCDPPYGVNKAEWDTAYPTWLEGLAFSIADTVCVMPGLWAAPVCISNMGAKYKSIIAGRNVNGMTFGPIGFNNWIPAIVGGRVPNRGQDCFEFSVGQEAKPDHPSPKPLSYMMRLVERVTECGATVLDCFMGSGTTGVACARLGRRFVGVECHEPYFDIACRRIEQAQRQGDLLRDMPAAADPADARMADMFAGDAA